MFNLMFIHKDNKLYLNSSFSERLSKEFYSDGLMNHSVHNGIGHSLIPDDIIPVPYRYLSVVPSGD